MSCFRECQHEHGVGHHLLPQHKLSCQPAHACAVLEMFTDAALAAAVPQALCFGAIAVTGSSLHVSHAFHSHIHMTHVVPLLGIAEDLWSQYAWKLPSKSGLQAA